MTKAIDFMLEELRLYKWEAQRIDEARKVLEAEIIDKMEAQGRDKAEWGDPDSPHRATIVYSTTVKIDADALQQRVSVGMWAKITKRVLDEKALEDKVARGTIDVNLVAECSTETPRKPYVKITTPK